MKPPLCRRSSQGDRSSGPKCSSCSKSHVGVFEVHGKIGKEANKGGREGHKDAQSLSHACPRDENVIMLCATLYVLSLWVYCSHLPSVGWRFFSRQPKPVLPLRKKKTRQ